jgi:purine-cytosine permease-like protein
VSEDPGLRRYRRILVALVLCGAVLAAGVGGWLIFHGKVFPALMALLCVGFFGLLAHGYRQDEEERDRGGS